MDIAITPITTAGLVRSAQPSAPSHAPAPQAAPQKISSSYDDSTNDAAAVRALVSFEHTYAVSDKKFAIYKDSSGQLITRYVSLRDGSITYQPAPSFEKSAPPQIAIKV